jgi:hypothetical protein
MKINMRHHLGSAPNIEIADGDGYTLLFTPVQAMEILVWLDQHKGELTRLVNAPSERDTGEQITFIRGCTVSQDAQNTGKAWSSGHDDDTGEYITAMEIGAKRTVQGENIRYEFPDGTVLVQHDEILETEQEMKDTDEGMIEDMRDMQHIRDEWRAYRNEGLGNGG